MVYGPRAGSATVGHIIYITWRCLDTPVAGDAPHGRYPLRISPARNILRVQPLGDNLQGFYPIKSAAIKCQSLQRGSGWHPRVTRHFKELTAALTSSTCLQTINYQY
ncbi:hypothetical protein NDU88_008314 [Pleurodeles waltl]|uniref:Uncharacterized protein n=1 Tax=Pleurodeles waltl TaxID=8319 RepID=A0AAV7NCQ4_PLEWA|nr:hypothetical protein NDU88_008314 [Pleurodeles waltl]